MAKDLGRDVDTYGEGECENAWFKLHNAKFEAEEARRAALSPEERRKEDIAAAASWFRERIKPQMNFNHLSCHLYHYPTFVLQLAPDSHNGATCRFSLCTDRIRPGEYRITVSPGEWGGGKIILF